MKKLIPILVVTALLVVVLFAAGPFFIVNEGEQAVVVRFGKIISIAREAGLHFKTPFVDNIVVYPKRILAWDGEPQRIPTLEKQFIWVDTTARWRISDPEKFYAAVTTLEGAYGRLDNVIDSAVRTVITQNYLREAVRNSNAIQQTKSTETFETGDAAGSEVLGQLTQVEAVHESIAKGRRALAYEMLSRSQELTPEFGIEILDVQIRQIKYTDELTESVYKRMVSERNQIAQAFRSFGEGKKAEWFGKLENEKRSLLSAAYMEAETIKGRADAVATQIFAESYGRDPSFFSFWRSLESYRQTLPGLNKTLSTDMDYFRFLYGIRGR
ncbi:MAG TPA: protease modulator HflC [Magnetospirillaceae bacterium]|nr:protease modulator HflC [Magnetospirillaceae bacterium]